MEEDRENKGENGENKGDGGWTTGGSDAVPAATGGWDSEQPDADPKTWNYVGGKKQRKHLDEWNDTPEEAMMKKVG